MTSPQYISSSSVSRSSRQTFSDHISAIAVKIHRALSSAGRAIPNEYDPETQSIASTIVEGDDRSNFRDREAGYHSFGRGGAGKFRSVSNSNSAVQEFPWPRGRERTPVCRPTQASAPSRFGGRGGAGNFIESPLPEDPSSPMRDREIRRAHAEADRNMARSSGRGGLGNIVTSDSRSCSRSIDPVSSPTSLRLS
ncbi:hypothetical protein FB451DRAFT_1360590 [Mycena latifolia]|nr:hypothetical protein FB451DRAFT_1360590 [Mycena latifolia]